MVDTVGHSSNSVMIRLAHLPEVTAERFSHPKTTPRGNTETGNFRDFTGDRPEKKKRGRKNWWHRPVIGHGFFRSPSGRTGSNKRSGCPECRFRKYKPFGPLRQKKWRKKWKKINGGKKWRNKMAEQNGGTKWQKTNDKKSMAEKNDGTKWRNKMAEQNGGTKWQKTNDKKSMAENQWQKMAKNGGKNGRKNRKKINGRKKWQEKINGRKINGRNYGKKKCSWKSP